MFKDRIDAASVLAKELRKYKGKDGVILAIPRGGVEIGYLLSETLGFPLDVALIKKIGHPYNKEYAIGSVSLDSFVLNEDARVSKEYIDEEVQKTRELLQERYNKYKGDEKPIDLENKVVIIVDDGIATGQTMRATIELVKNANPRKLIVAVPVAPTERINDIGSMVDKIIVASPSRNFTAIGQFYENFAPVSDEQVKSMLSYAKEAHN